MMNDSFLQRALIGLPVLFLSLTVHEFAHAWSAHKFGDDTAKNMGRMTLNPLAHLDWLGVLVMVVSQFRFGWAKPVPVNLMNLRNPRVADTWISAAGPISNIGLAIVFGIAFRLTILTDNPPEAALELLGQGVIINIVLAFFNLIPLFPLDGSHVLRNMLSPAAEEAFDKFNMIAPFLLLILVFSGGLWYVLNPIVSLLVPIIGGFSVG
jgi:Zn-dependent protease